MVNAMSYFTNAMFAEVNEGEAVERGMIGAVLGGSTTHLGSLWLAACRVWRRCHETPPSHE